VPELLERLGAFPRTIVHLDFETFYSSEYSLRKQTNEAYVRDERFQVIGVAVRVQDRPSVWLEEWDFRRWASCVDWSRTAISAHHAQFDGAILSERYDVRPAFWFCTMSMGRALHGEGALEKLATRFGLGAKGDAIESGSTRGKRREQLTQKEWLAFGEYSRNDVDLGAGLLKAMGPTFPRSELWLIDTTIRMSTEPVFQANLEVLRKALAEEKAKKRQVLEAMAKRFGKPGVADPLEAMRAVLSSSDKFAELLAVIGIEPPTKLNPKGEPIFAFAKTDPGMASLLEHERDDVRVLAESRLEVKSTIIETRTERMIGIAQRGRVPFYLKFCGAHTHRWSGGDKMNPQNFNRGGALRDAIEAPDGFTLVVADSGQIEARVLPWVAGESALLETFRRNDAKALAYETKLTELLAAGVPEKEAKKQAGDPGDFYSDVGSSFFLKKISKAETPTERQLSKNMILGLGFQMGWSKFSGELLKGMLGSDPVQFTQVEALKFGVDVAAFEVRPWGNEGETCGQVVRGMVGGGVRLSIPDLMIHAAVADHFVRLYRSRNAAISRFWKACDAILRAMEPSGGDPDAVRLSFKGLKVVRHGIVKPSGLTLRYPGLRKGPLGFTYLGGKSGREVTKIYGGLLTENIVQSLARDIVAEQALRVRADGVKIGTTTHDEIVAVVPELEGARTLARMREHMRTAPAWCADLPLNASGGFGKSYGAVK
jgi:hypothetical protein